MHGVFEDVVTGTGFAQFSVEVPRGFLVELFQLFVGRIFENLGYVAQDAIDAFPAGKFFVAFLDVFRRNATF